MTIPRRFAIAATEVTITQFQKFLKTNANPHYNVQASFLASTPRTRRAPGSRPTGTRRSTTATG